MNGEDRDYRSDFTESLAVALADQSGHTLVQFGRWEERTPGFRAYWRDRAEEIQRAVDHHLPDHLKAPPVRTFGAES